MSPEDAVLACEARLRKAQFASDADELDRLLADDLTFVGPDGAFQTKEDDLAAHRSGLLRFERLEVHDQRMFPVGDCMVVMVRARISGRFGEEPFGGLGVWTRVWRRAGDGWVLGAAHCGNLPT